MPETKQHIQPITRSAQFLPDTYNEVDNTIEVVAATESEVLMRNWDTESGFMREVLGMQTNEIRMERFLTANLLDNHDRFGSVGETILGAVVDAYTKGTQLICKLRFSVRENVKEIIKDVRAGIIRNISVQYRVYAYHKQEEIGQIPIYRAIDWEPFEVSFVSVPADFKATARSENNLPTNEVIITNSNNRNMPGTNENGTGADNQQQQNAGAPGAVAEGTRSDGGTPTPAPTPTPSPAAGEGEERNAGKKANLRSINILNAVRAAGFDVGYATDLISNETITEDRARQLILEKLGEGQAPAQRSANPGTINVNADETDKLRTACIDGLVLRSGQINQSAFKPEQVSAARNFRGMTLLDIAKDCLIRGGMSYKEMNGMSKMDIVGRAITSSTSDFPILLEGTNRRILLANYDAVADTWKRFCMVGSVSDFREHKRLRMGSFSRLDKLNENAEYKNKAIPDADYEKISASTFGNTINVSRQMIINDDLNAFSRLSSMLGRAAARSIEIDVYALLALNSGFGPTMEDGKALFHTDHANIGVGAALSVTSIEAMRVLMAKQMDPSGNDYLDIRPKVLLTSISQGGEARVINDAQYDTSVSNKFQVPNRVRGLFTDIIDTPRLSGTTFYTFADPNDEPVLEVAFLDGQQAPYMESQQEWNVDGMSWKIRMDYGTGAIGFKGAAINAGA